MANRTCSGAGCERPHRGRGLCRTHLDRLNRTGTVAPRRSPSTEELFWAKVDRPSPSACWTWMAAKTDENYGMFHSRSIGYLGTAYGFAYRITVGPVPEGLELDHVCHTRDLSCPGGPTCPHRLCVNPDHLEPVTQRENSARSRQDFGQANRGKTHCDRGHPFDAENTYNYTPSDGRPRRKCRTCRRDAKRKSAA